MKLSGPCDLDVDQRLRTPCDFFAVRDEGNRCGRERFL